MNFLSAYLRIEKDNPSSSQETIHDAAALFREAMQGVKPLAKTGRKVMLSQSKRRLFIQPHVPILPCVDHDLPGGHQQEIGEGDEWSFARPGLQRYTLRKLRRGYWSIQDELDLHGLNRDEAYRVLITFLEAVILQGYRCVRVIHGRGLSSKNRRPVLKILTGNWLMRHDDVLAFCQALPEHGGSGAVLVLLRNADKSP
ncbi:DNA-nicking endonuclease, Smr domain [Nitrosomonas eutropha]|uniref:Smr/MutS family protein n=1 Tax=Nitrosomonas eutropha TaxID=916 RepID=UPI00088C5C28|nr:Smr/MutS family protein [Nitrosomonas eutropha]SCX07528.1 DNA-nicking endonuclease, Smr domain [Nitrosomonas eutropha]